MAVKAVEMVRKIRDEIYEETKELSLEEQIEFFRRESKKLQEEWEREERVKVGKK